MARFKHLLKIGGRTPSVQFRCRGREAAGRPADGQAMTLRTTAAAVVAIALLALPATATAGKGSKPAVREFTGTVSAVKGKSFTLRRSGRAAVVVKLARKSRVAKGAKPLKGRKLVVKARRVKKAWVARSVKLVPVATQEDDEFATEDDDLLDEEPLGEADAPEESEPELDLEDTFEDLLPGGDE